MIKHLIKVKYRNITLVSFTASMKLFGMMISFGGFIFINMIALYNYNCVLDYYHRECYNKEMKPIHFVFIALALPCTVLCLIFFIYFKFKIRIGRPVLFI